MFTKKDVVHNSDEQVREYLQKALRMEAELCPDDALRAAVFSKAVELYSSKTVTLEQVGVGGILAPNARH